MLIKIDKDDFQKGLQTTVKALSTQSTLPILSGVLLKAETDKTVVMYTTNLDMATKTTVAATVKKKGTVVVPARLLGDIFRALPTGAVQLSSEAGQNRLSVEAGRGRFEISAMAAEDFPAFPTVENGTELVLDRNALTGALAQLLKSTAKDETRPVLNGVLFSYEAGQLEMVSTDSYRLSRRQIPVAKGPKEGFSQIVPYRALDEVARMTGGKTITVVFGESQVIFEGEGTTISSRLIEGKFPDYKRLLPGDQHQVIVAAKDDLMGAMNRSSLLVEKNNAVYLTVGNGSLTIKSESAGLGAIEENVPVESGAKEEFVVAFNVKYFLDGISSTEGDKITVGLESPTHPAVFLSEHQKDFLYLIMPLRT